MPSSLSNSRLDGCMEIGFATPINIAINTFYRHTGMDLFKSFPRFIIFIIEGFIFGRYPFICGGVVPFISVGGPATTAAAAVATVARRAVSSAAAAITLVAVIAS